MPLLGDGNNFIEFATLSVQQRIDSMYFLYDPELMISFLFLI